MIIKLKLTLFIVVLFSSLAWAQYPEKSPHKDLLKGAVDFHIHSGPDIFDRSVTDFEVAALAEKAGMSAIVLKNHISSTAARAALVNSQFSNIRVYGGVALNKAVGGVNPEAVEWMCRLSPEYGKVVFFPTFDAAHHKSVFQIPGEGLQILKDGKLSPETKEILRIIARENLILATGHISPEEIQELVSEAKRMDIKKIVINHPFSEAPGLSMSQMKELAGMGAILELTYLSYLSGPQAPLGFLKGSKHISIEMMVEAIRSIGAEHFILSSDLGQSGNPTPPDGLKNFAILLMDAGISKEEIVMMIKTNPMKLFLAH